MGGVGHDIQLFVLAAQGFECVFAEVTRVGVFTVHHQRRGAHFGGVLQERHINHAEHGGIGPRAVGVGIHRTRVEAALGGVILRIFSDEFRRIRLDLFGGEVVARQQSGVAVFRAFPTGVVDVLLHFIARIGIHAVVIAFGRHARHVVHGAGGHGLDAGVADGGIERKTTEAANTQNADFITVDVIQRAEKIHRCAEVFGVDVGRGHIAWRAAALAGVGRVKCECDKAALGQGLRIQAGRLLFHRAKRAAHGNGRQFAACVFRHIQICRQRDAVAVFKGDFAVRYLVALRKNFVPFLGELDGLRGNFDDGCRLGGVGVCHGVGSC